MVPLDNKVVYYTRIGIVGGEFVFIEIDSIHLELSLEQMSFCY